ncbi:MAG: Rz1-like lysis system protein LysC [Serratia liquefaciens]|nr:Rz1-like lysis system protein LysC [Serratia liquefaciens]
MTLSGCTPAPTLPPPTIIYAGCPKVSSCPLPGSSPKTNGDLSADIFNLERALASCALQVETVKKCQEEHDVKTEKSAQSAL